MKSQRNGPQSRSARTRLEDRVARLEAEVASLKQTPPAAVPGGWESIVGIDRGNPFFQEMVNAMKRHRDEDYSQARGQARTKKRRRSAATTK
jgi:hypothetical protein